VILVRMNSMDQLVLLVIVHLLLIVQMEGVVMVLVFAQPVLMDQIVINVLLAIMVLIVYLVHALQMEQKVVMMDWPELVHVLVRLDSLEQIVIIVIVRVMDLIVLHVVVILLVLLTVALD